MENKQTLDVARKELAEENVAPLLSSGLGFHRREVLGSCESEKAL